MISDIAPFFPHTPHITILTVVTLLHSVKLFPLECSYSGSPAMQNSACCMQRLHWALYLKAVMIMAGADVYVCMLSCFSHDRLFVTLWTVAHQAPLSMYSSGQNIGVGYRVLLQQIFLTQWSNQGLPYCRDGPEMLSEYLFAMHFTNQVWFFTVGTFLIAVLKNA